MASIEKQSPSPAPQAPAAGFASLFTFKSFRSRLVVFLLCLLLPVLGGIFYYVNQNNEEYTEETINTYLELGANVFDFTRQQQAYTLEAITASLTWDFGFRSAFAANDPATLFDAALNVLERSLGIADMLMIADLDNQVIIDTELQGGEMLTGTWLELVQEADASEEGIAEKIVTIGEDPFQLIALPLYLPRQVAWIIGGFALDDGFVQQVSDTIVSDVSILRLQPGQPSEIVASTLIPTRQPILLEQLQTEADYFDNLQRIDFGDEEYTTLLRSLYQGPLSGGEVLAVIQRSYDENNENVLQFRNLLIQFYSLVIVLSLIAVIYLARSITNPLSHLANAVKRIEAGDYAKQVPVRSRDELGELADSVNSMASGLAEKEKVRDLLGKVVSHQIAEELLSNPVELGGEERTATILFSDIRGFTSYCEDLPPQQVLGELNKVLSCISDIVEAHNGVVDKFQGDAVMALFGAPVSSRDDAANAMAAGLEIIAAVGSAENPLSACVGINTGLVVAGNLGSANRLNYSVIGDAVNLAARLESLTRLYNVANIVSAASKAAAPGFVYRELDEVQVVGKNRSVSIYELVGTADTVTPAKQEELALFASALAAYRQQDWPRAREQFTQLLETCDNAALHRVFLQRIKHYEDNLPGPDWLGVYTFDKK
ncbi:MAG: HAMP domain-containing protein [Pseudomonadales bacterium]|nr:HAMP domain-containing protein [Pseudomonadales bacterium]MBL6816814.1 HAMP domain-containing protein [Pseudomonadales bacterium]